MTPLNVVAIAVALAMDAFAVSIASGICLRTVSYRQTFRLAWHFGLFQALMPVIGFAAGIGVRDRIEAFDHWIAFALLILVGANMIKEALQGDDGCEPRKDPTKGSTLVVLSVATSIDALAVGFSISVLSIAIWQPALIIGVVAGAFTVLGLQLGCRVGRVQQLCRYAEITGALVLFAIGLKILFDHGVLGLA